MTTKRKIQIAVVLVALGISTTVFWPFEEQEEVRVTFVGVSPNDSNHVLFTITNGSKSPFFYEKHVQRGRPGHWEDADAYDLGRVEPEEIMGRSATNCEFRPVIGERWRICVHFVKPGSFVFRSRRMLQDYARFHDWQRIARWVDPGGADRWKNAYGPIMLGNKPAPP